MRTSSWFGVTLAVAACTEVPDPALAAIESWSEGGCGANNSSGCGENGAIVEDGTNIAWVQPDHSPYEGMRYLHFATSLKNLQDGIYQDDATLDVYNPLSSQLPGNALRYGSETRWFTGAELLGVAFRIETRGGPQYDIEITEVHNDLSYWTQAPSGFAESYRFVWYTVGVGPQNYGEVCPYDADPPLYPHAQNAVVFEGEHYDPTTRKITPTSYGNLYTDPFNIACVRGLPYKQEMARRTGATVNNTYHTTIGSDRQAMVHMWAAEYCRSVSFTHQSHKLRVKDKRGWLPPSLGWVDDDERLAAFNFEAVWNGARAVCLETPRLAVYDPKVPADPRIWDEIRTVCGAEMPPRCKGQSWFPKDWRDHGDFLTATISGVVVPRP